MSASAPLGEVVEVARTTEPPKLQAMDSMPADFDDSPVTDWQASSFALLNGCQVKDYTERIPDRVFNALFGDD